MAEAKLCTRYEQSRLLITGRRIGWHTAAMTDAPPPDPKANDVWIDEHGELKYFNGDEWVPYPDIPDGDLQPEVVIRVERD